MKPKIFLFLSFLMCTSMAFSATSLKKEEDKGEKEKKVSILMNEVEDLVYEVEKGARDPFFRAVKPIVVVPKDKELLQKALRTFKLDGMIKGWDGVHCIFSNGLRVKIGQGFKLRIEGKVYTFMITGVQEKPDPGIVITSGKFKFVKLLSKKGN